MGFDQHDNVDTPLINYINESLGIISSEVFEHPELVGVRKGGRYKINALIRGKGGSDQSLPGGITE